MNAEVQFTNVTSNSLRLSPFKIYEVCSSHFRLEFPRIPSYAHEPSTLNDYMQQAERTLESVGAILAEERQSQIHVVLLMDKHIRMSEGEYRWGRLVPE